MFYLNGTEVQEPVGWDGVYWQRVRNPEYFGVWRQRTAAIKGVGEVGFEQDERQYLQQLWARNFANASALFEVREGGQSLYSAEIDFGLWSDDGRRFNVSFRDEDIQLDTMADIKTTIEPKIQIQMPQQAISTGISYTIGKDFLTSFSTGTRQVLPWSSSESGKDGNGLSVTDLNQFESIYRNGSDKDTSVRLEGLLMVKWSGSGIVTIKAETSQDGTNKESKIIGLVPISATEQRVYLSGSIEVPRGYNLKLLIETGGSVTALYNSASSLTIYEDSASSEAFVWGLTWRQAVESLLVALVGDSVKLSSNFLTKGNGAERTLTSERNLRGFKTGIQVSLKSLLKDMIAIENLAVWKRNGILYIETKADMLKMVGRGRIQFFDSLVHSPVVAESLPMFISNCKVSYQNWKSETGAGLDEFCSDRVFVSQQSKTKGGYTLQISTLSASGKIMESLRRNNSNDKADTNQDQNLFVIVAEKRGDLYQAKTGNVSGVLDSANAINGDISPRQILKNWSTLTATSGVFKFESGSGNVSAIVNGEPENSPVLPTKPLFTGRYVTIGTGMTMKDYSQLGEVIEYIDHDGRERAFLLASDSYRFAKGQAILSGYELNE